MTHRAAEPTSTFVPAPSNQDARSAELRRWKRYMLLLLVLAAVVFLSCSWWQNTAGGAPGWVGYLRAFAEAGMVGGLADWFAVTALFRHPMGLKIPHTALIPENKDKVGDALSEFVEENFLTPDALSGKIHEWDVPRKAAEWITGEGNAHYASEIIGTRLASVIRDIDPEDAATLIQSQIIDRAMEPEWGPPAGRVLESFIAEGKARPLEDDLIAWAHAKILTMEDTVVTTIDERMPGWAPRFARNLVGEKVYAELVGFADEVVADSNHEARLAIRRNLSKLAQDLQWDPQLIAKVEGIKADVLVSDRMQRAPEAIWASVSATLVEMLEDETSLLRTKIETELDAYGHRLLADPEKMAELSELVDKAARYLAEKFAPDLVSIIPETIKSWDATEASENIELMVGKDLQFIRLNGTLVGGFAGLAIYSANQLFLLLT